MTVDEIFSEINNHMIEGIMLHDQLATYYGFLGLNGYKRCHKYHTEHEAKARRKLIEYFTAQYCRLLPEDKADDPRVIPDGWRGHVQKDVSSETKRRAVRDGFTHWHEWEKATKELYEKACKELFDIGEIAAAMCVSKLIKNVDGELKDLESEMLALVGLDYNLEYICERQHDLHEKYKRKMKGG